MIRPPAPVPVGSETDTDGLHQIDGVAQAYRALLGAGALDVVRLAADGSLLADLPGWRALTGRTGELCGHEWLEDVHAADRAQLRAHHARVHQADVPVVLTFRIRAARCGERLLRAQLVGVADSAGAVAGWVGRLDDVTDVLAHDARILRTAAAVTALALTVTVDDVVTCVEEVLLGLVGARACAVHVDPGPEAASNGALHQPLMVSRGYRSTGEPGLVLPLTVGGARPGSWHLLGLADGALEPGSPERTVLETVAAQLAQSLSRAQLLEESRSTARLLQRALLPERLPQVPGLEIAARYRSAEGSEVGGDWYDVLRLPGDGAGLVLGDVMGRGVRAAATMGQVRNALRGIAVLEPTPAAMLTALDRFFESFDPDEITTLVITVLDPVTGVLHVGNAGHLPPLVVRTDGRTGYLDDGASTPLGVPTVRVACKGTVLHPGDLLVMCSDGLIERRDRSLSDGLALLQRTARRLADDGLPLEELADALLREVLAGQGSDDDVSLLLVRLPG